MTWIKICGTTNLDDALASVEAGADALGFVFAPSPRRISPRDAGRIIAALPPTVEKIGIFVNQAVELVLDTVKKAGLTGVQLHGDENVSFARALRDAAPQLRLMKAVSMHEVGQAKGKTFAVAAAQGADTTFSALLLDSGSNGKRGGTGVPFDWQEAAPMARLLARKFALVIAGGLNPDNVGKALEIFQPWGVDVVSGVEEAPGKKNPAKLQSFIAAVRRCQSGATGQPKKNAVTRR